MSDERRWKLTGVHGNPAALRLADGHGPQLPGPDEVIEVVEVAALARVERERDEAREEAAAISDALGAMTDERDALRAPVKALTGERAGPFRVQALPMSDIVPRWSTHDTLSEAQARAAAFKGADRWHHVQIRDKHGNVVWDRDNDGFDALAAARDAAAAKTPDQTPTEETS